MNASAQDSEEAPERAPKKKKKGAAKADSVELYNLSTDISEKTTLAEKEPERVATMRAKLSELLKNAVPPGNLGREGDSEAKPAKKK